MNLIIFGPPGAGKGTYSNVLQEQLRIKKISTGDILRKEVKDQTELGKKAYEYMSKGALVPDEMVIEIVKKEVNNLNGYTGFILDGFPRTVEQAKALEKIAKIDYLILIQVPEEIIIEKLSGRRVCSNPSCGAIYNVANINKKIGRTTYILPPMLPKKEGVCDKCGSPLIQRDDDKPEVIKHRLEVYAKESKPVLEYYKGRIEFIKITANRDAAVVAKRLIKKLIEKQKK